MVTADGEWIGAGTLGWPEDQDAALIGVLKRYARRYPSGTITIPLAHNQAAIHSTSDTTHLRAVARSVRRLHRSVAVSAQSVGTGQSLSVTSSTVRAPLMAPSEPQRRS
jgi:hypothetical protein